VIQCESYNTAIGPARENRHAGFLVAPTAAESILRDFLQQIPVVESLPSFIVGMFYAHRYSAHAGRRSDGKKRSLRRHAHWLPPLEACMHSPISYDLWEVSVLVDCGVNPLSPE